MDTTFDTIDNATSPHNPNKYFVNFLFCRSCSPQIIVSQASLLVQKLDYLVAISSDNHVYYQMSLFTKMCTCSYEVLGIMILL